ncbi:MAG: hypothetical protein GXP28_09340, partial [Planctomycetes bacterium]|nr:hypothetical protein [Planctomycetota bacterium]
MNLFATPWQQTWELIAWTMCYFFVLGTAIALAGALLRWTCRRAAPSIRYAISLAVLAALALSPIGIAAWLTQATPSTVESKIAPPPGWQNITPPAERQTATPLPPLVVADASRPEG